MDRETLEELVRLVIAMRAAQKVYFLHRTAPALQRALACERAVDLQLMALAEEVTGADA